MDEALVKLDNNLVWDGIRQPFHELYYLKINDTNGKWALWLRYGFSTPSALHEGGTASLWAIYVEKGGEKIVLKKDFDMGVHDVVHADQFIQIDNSNLSLADCTGGIVSEKNTIKWELTFEDPVLSLRPYPYSFLYTSPFPPTKYLAPRLLGFVTGTIFINHKKIRLFRNRVNQGHLYGPSHLSEWAWANCIDFLEDTEAYFEGLTARVPLKKGVTRPLSLFCIGMEGEQFFANGIWKAVLQNKSHYDFNTWTCAFQKSGFRFECSIQREPESIVAVEWDSPGGDKRYCYNSLLSNIEIKVFKRKRGSWQDYKMLTAVNKCAFETGGAEMNSDFPFVLSK